MIIRDATTDDAAGILALYAPYIEKTAITFDYDVPTIADFRAHIAEILQKYPYIVALENDKIVGFAYASTLHEKAAYLHSAELSIYVDEKMRGGGIGTRIYAEIEKRLLARDITALYACIAATPRADDPYLTAASLRFHEHCGYKKVGYFTHCAIKFGLWYDVAYYEKHLTN